jgi:polyferredoxin
MVVDVVCPPFYDFSALVRMQRFPQQRQSIPATMRPLALHILLLVVFVVVFVVFPLMSVDDVDVGVVFVFVLSVGMSTTTTVISTAMSDGFGCRL